MTEPLAYSIPETGRMLGGICRASVYRLVNRQELELVKIGGRSMITAQSIKARVRGEPVKVAA